MITFMTLRMERHVAFSTHESAPGLSVFLFSAILIYTNFVFLNFDKVVVQSIIPDVIIMGVKKSGTMTLSEEILHIHSTLHVEL